MELQTHFHILLLAICLPPIFHRAPVRPNRCKYVPKVSTGLLHLNSHPAPHNTLKLITLSGKNNPSGKPELMLFTQDPFFTQWRLSLSISISAAQLLSKITVALFSGSHCHISCRVGKFAFTDTFDVIFFSPSLAPRRIDSWSQSEHKPSFWQFEKVWKAEKKKNKEKVKKHIYPPLNEHRSLYFVREVWCCKNVFHSTLFSVLRNQRLT